MTLLYSGAVRQLGLGVMGLAGNRGFKSLPKPSSSRFTRDRCAAQGDGAYRYERGVHEGELQLAMITSRPSIGYLITQ
jgi:hypothetical protein